MIYDTYLPNFGVIISGDYNVFIPAYTDADKSLKRKDRKTIIKSMFLITYASYFNFVTIYTK